MAYVTHEIGLLVRVDPKKAAEKISVAYKKSGANKRGAAEILGCDEHTLARWITTLGIAPELAKMAKRAQKEGWHHDRKRMGGRKSGGKNSPKAKS